MILYRFASFLHFPDNSLNLFRRLYRLRRQIFYFRGYHGKASSRFSRSCRLYAGIECKQIRLIRHLRDHMDDLCDVLYGSA